MFASGASVEVLATDCARESGSAATRKPPNGRSENSARYRWGEWSDTRVDFSEQHPGIALLLRVFAVLLTGVDPAADIRATRTRIAVAASGLPGRPSRGSFHAYRDSGRVARHQRDRAEMAAVDLARLRLRPTRRVDFVAPIAGS